MTIPGNSFFIANRLAKCLAQRNTQILYRVMRINFEITFGINHEIN